MSFTNAFGETELAWISRHVLLREATETDRDQLVAAVKQVSDHLDDDEIEATAQKLKDVREEHTHIAILESIAAMVARAICQSALATPNRDLDETAQQWISRNVTAGRAHVDRCRAIWRHQADLGAEIDKQIFEHAIASAKAGETRKPVPRIEETGNSTDTTPPSDTGTPNPPAQTGKEDTMIDPTKTRDSILKRFAFNPAGLPARLRDPDSQKVYVDAVVTAVALLGRTTENQDADGDLGAAERWSAHTAALMLLDGHYNPQDSRFFAHVQKTIVELSGSASEGSKVQIDGHRMRNGELVLGDDGPASARASTSAIEVTGSAGSKKGDPLLMSAPSLGSQRIAVFDMAYSILRRRMNETDRVFFQSLAVAGRKAVDSFADHGGDPVLMTPTVDAAYNDDIAAGGSGGGGGGVANVELPPLNDPAGYNDEIERENVRAVATIYVSYQLEFAITACARVLELFVAGLLPIPASDGSARELDNLYWDQDDLLDEASRRSIYARVLGAPGGELTFDIQPNTEFNTLLMRSVSAISEYEREQSALTHFDNAARGRRFQTTSGEFVRKAVRDFAANVSLRGWAGTAFTAERMAKQIRRVMKVLSLPTVRNAFGVSTPWQVIERVSQREFGLTVNTVLHRTLAVETQRIMGIIADNHTVWSTTSGGTQLFSETPRNDGDLSWDDSRALIVAAQHFRAVTGIGDGLMNEYSEPVETYASPSLPDGGGLAAIGASGGALPGIDMTGVNALRDLVNSGQTPSPDQILSMLPRI